MKRLLLFFLLFTIIPCSAQNIDSLRKIVFGASATKERLTAALQLSNYSSAKKPGQTLMVANIGLKLAAGLDNKKAAGMLLKAMARASYILGKHDSAVYYGDKAIAMYAKARQGTDLIPDYTDLANLYAQLKDYNKAIALYNEVLTFAPKTGARRELMDALIQLGTLYEAKNDYREALNYFRQSFDISDSLDFVQKTKKNTSEMYSRNFMLDVMGSIKQKEVSITDILKTIETKRSLNDTLALSINYFNLGVLYKSKRMFAQALAALQSCAQYASQINYTDMQSSAVNEMADLYEQTGDYRQSLDYLKKHAVLNSSAGSRNSKTLDELQTKYEITQREDQILQQQFEITKRNYWMAGILVITLLMLLMGFIYYKQTQLKQRNAAMQAIIETEENERKRIAQDLHDSVSQTMTAAKINLTVIGGELPFTSADQKIRFEKAIKLVDDGFREVRTISHNMMPSAFHETGLAQIIKQFIGSIEGGALSISFFSKGFDDPFEGQTEIILYRVLQESVNNVLKHAHASRLDISLIRDDDNISLTIEDNGRGFDAANPNVYRGMGMSNLKSRINFLNGKVEFSSEPGKGTLVSVYVPLAKKTL